MPGSVIIGALHWGGRHATPTFQVRQKKQNGADMISVYYLLDERLERGGLETLSAAALWIDLLEPTPAEEAAVQSLLGIEVPTREEMQEIEASSRLYRENEAVYVTAPVLTNADTNHPANTAITFILTRSCTVTVRYASPQPFQTFANRAMRQRGLCMSADAVLAGLLETIIDRLADVLERIGGELDNVSRAIFQANETTLQEQSAMVAQGMPPKKQVGKHHTTDFEAMLRIIGRNGDLSSKARDSLLGIGRILTYLGQAGESMTRKDVRLRIKTMTRDIRSLTEHAGFISSKINFLLDATLGMVNIEQNAIIKIFSVVAVIFLPPTLVASMYGMNFELIPELHWKYGYAWALALMVASAILPYLYFKRRGWL